MKTLRALGRQREVNGRFEVLVVDDGSTDGTAGLVRGSVFEAFEQRVIVLDAGGPARARNRGIAEASAERVLLLGDDTIPTPLALAAHLKAASKREIGIQGRIDWDPDQPVTDVMDFLAPAGPQFWFHGLTEGSEVPWAQVLGSNVSAPTRWFRGEPFDERFTDACLEDTELAWRWRRRGWATVWSEHALCHHRHHYATIEPFIERQQCAGRWARLAVATNWGMAVKLVLEPLLAFTWKTVKVGRWRLVGRGRDRDRWDLRCRKAYLRGLLAG